MSEAPHLLVREDGPILIATLNRPDKLNAVTGEMMRLFEQTLHRFRDTPELKVMLIRATGRYFCSGVDMKGSDGGGLELSLSCDFRLAARSAGYSFPEGLFGVLPASNGVSRPTRLCGPHWARWLIMANKKIDAERALLMGLVHEVFPDESFEDDAMAFCRHLAQQNAEQMGTAKLAIELASEVGRASARDVERLANSVLMQSPDYLAGVARYVGGIGRKQEKSA